MGEAQRGGKGGVNRIGFDIGGSKIAALALDAAGRELARTRQDVPRDYAQTLGAVRRTVEALVQAHGPAASVGIAMPGVIGADGTPVRAVNLPWLAGRRLRADLEQALRLPVAVANDANCFTLSEANDGAAAGAAVVFGATLGTGVGGGIVVNGRPLVGANAIAGEWGHNPLPLPNAAAGPRAVCGCGRLGCIESWLNGAALARDYARIAGRALDGPAIARLAAAGDGPALAALDGYGQRLAAALAGVVNLLDPDVIVLGGGLSALPGLFALVRKFWAPLIVAPELKTRLLPARFGAESGLRGAAWLPAAAQP
jgi:fructokinase